MGFSWKNSGTAADPSIRPMRAWNSGETGIESWVEVLQSSEGFRIRHPKALLDSQALWLDQGWSGHGGSDHPNTSGEFSQTTLRINIPTPDRPDAPRPNLPAQLQDIIPCPQVQTDVPPCSTCPPHSPISGLTRLGPSRSPQQLSKTRPACRRLLLKAFPCFDPNPFLMPRSRLSISKPPIVLALGSPG
jgi:hypothetical protein